MIQVGRGLELYKVVCKLVKSFKKDFKDDELAVDRLVERLECNGISVNNAEYDGYDVDLDIGTISVSFTNNLTPSPIVLMKVLPDKENEHDIGGWVEYNTETGNLTFPFMSW